MQAAEKLRQELLWRVDTENFAGSSSRVRRAGLSQSRRNAAVALSHGNSGVECRGGETSGQREILCN
jgi:hypothetical protein